MHLVEVLQYLRNLEHAPVRPECISSVRWRGIIKWIKARQKYQEPYLGWDLLDRGNSPMFY